MYLKDLDAGLILGKGGRPKKTTTIITDTGRIHRHITPLIGKAAACPARSRAGSGGGSIFWFGRR